MNQNNNENKYNGWTNYETWAVKLWLDNEEGSYRYWTQEARRHHTEENAAGSLARQLKDELTDAAPDLGATLFADLLNAALSEVNWYEIAKSYLDDLDEEKPTKEEDDEKVIFAYTRKHAITDGVLVDASETAKEAGFKTPVALTHAVWAQYVAVPDGVECQDEAGRLWDVLWMCRCGIERWKREGSMFLFHLHVRNDNREGEPPVVQLKAVCGPDDGGEPCITIMLPEED